MSVAEAMGRVNLFFAGAGAPKTKMSALDDSVSLTQDGALVEGPVFTKPQQWRGIDVPEVLMSGHHGKIAKWRSEQAQSRTNEMRPDL